MLRFKRQVGLVRAEEQFDHGMVPAELTLLCIW